MSRPVSIIASIIFVVLIAAIAFFTYKKEDIAIEITSQNPVQKQIAPVPSSQPKISQETVKEAITKAINSNSPENISPYLTAPTASLTIMSTECCGESTPKEILLQLQNMQKGVPFDFDQEQPTIVEIKQNNERLKNAFVGISPKGKQLIAFTIDNEPKITAVEISVSYEIYNF